MTVLLVVVALLWGVPVMLLILTGLAMMLSRDLRRRVHLALFGEQQAQQPFSVAIER